MHSKLIKRFRRVCGAWRRHHRSAGFGIHSPHAYRLVTEVLSERRHYYAYEPLAALRKSAVARSDSHWPHRNVPGMRVMRLLFRLTNHYNPSCLLQVGCHSALWSAVLLQVSSTSRLWLCEPELSAMPLREPLLERIVHHPTLPATLRAYNEARGSEPPYVLVACISENIDTAELAEALTAMAADNAVIIFANLRTDAGVQQVWQSCCKALAHGQTFSNGKTGILIANPKLQREHFDLWL